MPIFPLPPPPASNSPLDELIKKRKPHLHLKLIRMIRAADHRAAGHVDEAHFLGNDFVLGKCLRRHKFLHRQMPQGGLQILAKGEDVATRGAQIAHGLEQFLGRLAQSKHDARLGMDRITALLLDLAQHAQAAVVGGAVPHFRRQPPDSLKIVIIDVRVRREDGFDARVLVEKIRHEDFDDDPGIGAGSLIIIDFVANGSCLSDNSNWPAGSGHCNVSWLRKSAQRQDSTARHLTRR